jgi:hypothetical protein
MELDEYLCAVLVHDINEACQSSNVSEVSCCQLAGHGRSSTIEHTAELTLDKTDTTFSPRLIVGDDVVVDASPWSCNHRTHRRHHNSVLDLDPPNAPRAEQSLVHMLQHL